MSPPVAHSSKGSALLRTGALALVALAVLSAIGSGCGGNKTSETPATNSAAPGTSSPPSAPAETTAAPVAAADLGTKVFVTRCALCHGPDGRGDGPGAVALKPKPRNFHDKAYMSGRTDAQLLEVIHAGKGAMPKWGGVLTEAEITAVLAHVRELGEKP